MMNSPSSNPHHVEFDLLNRHHPRVKQWCEMKQRECSDKIAPIQKEANALPGGEWQKMSRLNDQIRDIMSQSRRHDCESLNYPELREAVLAKLTEMVTEGWRIEGFTATNQTWGDAEAKPDISILLRRERA